MLPASGMMSARTPPSTTGRPAVRFTVVIPAYNEADYLPGLLDSLDVARATYGGGSGAIEVIVADNASTDATAAVARERGCHLVRVEERVIAAARNGGARAARGEVLCFVDADSSIHPRAFDRIERFLADGSVIGGATGLRFDRRSLGLACTYALLVLVALLLRGPRTVRPLNVDAGLVFCRREDFFLAGPYREDVLYAEDVLFLRALQRLGRARGQRLVSGTRARTVTSTRKFDAHGDWHYFFMPARILWDVIRRRPIWARGYWYDRRGTA